MRLERISFIAMIAFVIDRVLTDRDRLPGIGYLRWAEGSALRPVDPLYDQPRSRDVVVLLAKFRLFHRPKVVPFISMHQLIDNAAELLVAVFSGWQ